SDVSLNPGTYYLTLYGNDPYDEGAEWTGALTGDLTTIIESDSGVTFSFSLITTPGWLSTAYPPASTFWSPSSYTTYPLINITGEAGSDPISCLVQLDKTVYSDGDAVVATMIQLKSPLGIPVPVEFKLWFDIPGGWELAYARGGSDDSVVLPSGF